MSYLHNTSGTSTMTKPLPVAPPLRIFVVENHRDTLVSFCMLLESLGHTVFSASTVEEALLTVPQTDCDVLISDIGLADGNGWDLLERLHLPAHVYPIAMSGFGMAADRARSKAAGFRHHLVKPMGLEQLEQILEQARTEVRALRPA
jgi:two-component system CheB/CheR fusion protein